MSFSIKDRFRFYAHVLLSAIALGGIATQSADVPHVPVAVGPHGFLNFGVTSQAFRETLDTTYAALPAQTRAYLKEKGVSVVLGPTRDSIDLPSTTESSKLSSAGNETRTLQNQSAGAYSHFYRRVQVAQYEYKQFVKPVAGSFPTPENLAANEWVEIGSTELAGVLRHETGHAVDHNLNRPSSSYGFKAAVDLDVAAMGGMWSAITQHDQSYLVRPNDIYGGYREIFAETWAGLYGGSNVGMDVASKYPATTAWVRDYQRKFENAYAAKSVDALIRDVQELPDNLVAQREVIARGVLENANDPALVQKVATVRAAVDALGDTPESAKLLVKMATAEFAASIANKDPNFDFYARKFYAANVRAEYFENVEYWKVVNDFYNSLYSLGKTEVANQRLDYAKAQFASSQIKAASDIAKKIVAINAANDTELADAVKRIVARMSSDDMIPLGAMGQKLKSTIVSEISSQLRLSLAASSEASNFSLIDGYVNRLGEQPEIQKDVLRDCEIVKRQLTNIYNSSVNNFVEDVKAIRKQVGSFGDAGIEKATERLIQVLGYDQPSTMTDTARLAFPLLKEVLEDFSKVEPYDDLVNPGQTIINSRLAYSVTRLKREFSKERAIKSDVERFPEMFDAVSLAVNDLETVLDAYTKTLDTKAYNNKILDLRIVNSNATLREHGAGFELLTAFDDLNKIFSDDVARENPQQRNRLLDYATNLSNLGYYLTYADKLDGRIDDWAADLRREAVDLYGGANKPVVISAIEQLNGAVRRDFKVRHETYLSKRLPDLQRGAFDRGVSDLQKKAAYTTLGDAYRQLDEAFSAEVRLEQANARGANALAFKELRVGLAERASFTWSHFLYDNVMDPDELKTDVTAAADEFTIFRKRLARAPDSSNSRSIANALDAFERTYWATYRMKRPEAAPFIEAGGGPLAHADQQPGCCRPKGGEAVPGLRQTLNP